MNMIRRWKPERSRRSPRQGDEGGQIETKMDKSEAPERRVCPFSFNLGGSLLNIKQYSETKAIEKVDER